jgi:hypothetical protein
MRTSLAAATALAGSLLLPCLMLGSAQAVTSAPNLKNVISITDNGTINGTLTPVRAGGGGGFAGGGAIWEVADLAVTWAVSRAIWVAWALVILVAWVAIWVVSPVAPSMVAPDLPVEISITITSITGTS